MHEYVTRALVLEKKPAGEADARVVFFSEKLGRVEARARSARKITSRLAAHLEPGVLSLIRVVENRGAHVADALKIAKTEISLYDLYVMSRLAAPHQRDARVWNLLISGAFAWGRMLTVLGWDSVHATCTRCAGAPVALFHFPRQEFYCAECINILGIAEDEVVYV